MDTPLLVRPIMKRLILLTFTLLLFSSGCDSKFIDDIFTFNVEKSFEFTIPAVTPADTTLSLDLPGITLVDSADLSKPGASTTFSLLKSARLTKLQMTFNDPSFTLANFDTLNLRISSTNHPQVSLAYYSTGLDSIRLTNEDFVQQLKDNSASIGGTYRLNTAPTQNITVTCFYTIAITAHPF